MAASSATLHEDAEKLKQETIDNHRAIVSLMEEIEATDWYEQRVDAATDGELTTILKHNSDEEKEHASMLLEWLRRRDAKWDQNLRTYLFTDKPILSIEKDGEEGDGEGGEASDQEGSLGIGSLRGVGGIAVVGG
ncbi:MAG: ferritin [Alphaproteobacteria bacterium]|nr:ferritin [Alphaproteobacteria bacterium]